MKLGERALVYGPGDLSAGEALRLLVGDAAARKIDAAGIAYHALPQTDLRAVGLTAQQAARVAAAFALVAGAAPLPREVKLGQSADVAAYFSQRIGGLPHEELHALYLDSHLRVIASRRLAVGGVTGVSVHPREVFAPALACGAAGVILAHNHPSGDPTPSNPDRDLTARCHRIGRDMGIPLHDHVIVTRDPAHHRSINPLET